jgi:hypothetical protein
VHPATAMNLTGKTLLFSNTAVKTELNTLLRCCNAKIKGCNGKFKKKSPPPFSLNFGEFITNLITKPATY